MVLALKKVHAQFFFRRTLGKVNQAFVVVSMWSLMATRGTFKGSGCAITPSEYKSLKSLIKGPGIVSKSAASVWLFKKEK